MRNISIISKVIIFLIKAINFIKNAEQILNIIFN